MVRQRVRIRFSKQNDLRWIGHLDLVRCVERLFRRARVPLSMSEGFHPKPRMTFPAALAVGIEGTDEVLEVELSEPLGPDELQARLGVQMPSGLTVHAIEVLPPEARKGQVRSFGYRVPVPTEQRTGLAERIERLLAAEVWPVARPNGKKPVDLRRQIESLVLADGTLRFQLLAGQPGEGSAGPRDVLAALELDDLERHGVHLTRDHVELLP